MPQSQETPRPESDPATLGVAYADPAYRAAVTDLLGVIAYGEIAAFERLADDAKLSPTLEDRVALATMAGTQIGYLNRLNAQLRALGADPFAVMEPFRAVLDDFHAHTSPRDYLEGLVKAYVGDGLARDFYREIAAFVDVETRELIMAALSDTDHAAFVVDRVKKAIAADHRVAGRLALWGRRLMGEALTQAQRVAADHDALASLIAGGVDRPGMDLAALGRMFTRLTEQHSARMADLGLEA